MTTVPPDPRIPPHKLRPLKVRRFDLAAGMAYVLAWLQDEQVPSCDWETRETSLSLLLRTDPPSLGPDGRTIVHVNGTHRVYGHGPMPKYPAGQIDRTLDGIKLPELVTFFFRPRGPEQVGIQVVWPDNGLDLVPEMIIQRMMDHWTKFADSDTPEAAAERTEPTPLRVVRPDEDELQNVAKAIRKLHEEGHRPGSITQKWTLARVEGWSPKTLQRHVKPYMESRGLATGRRLWPAFVRHVLTSRDHFQS